MSLFTRRQAIRLGTFGTAFTFADQLRAANRQKMIGQQSKSRSAILIFLTGGPPHLDTWDPKPDAPAEIRGAFGSIATAISGIRLSEHFPQQARLLDKMTVVRSVTGMSDEHADVHLQTGYPSAVTKANGSPSFGSIVSKMRGWRQGVPPFVSLRGLTAGSEPGFLSMAHRPFTPGDDQTESDLRLPANVSRERQEERRALQISLAVSDQYFGRLDIASGVDDFQQQAFEMINSGRIRKALSIKGECDETLERFSGVESLLKARRLVEAGVGCVTVSLGAWDLHKNSFANSKDLLSQTDHGIAALIQDLNDRQLTNEVVVLAWGEFGRTPRVNRYAGRDHWTPVMSAVIVGGGLKMGQIIGSTDRHGEQPDESPCTVQQVLATVYQTIGIDPGTTLTNASGRPIYLLDDREPIRELI